MAKKNLIVGQSGGPTAVINSSLYGVVSEGLSHPDTIEHVYGMVNGIEGFLNDCVLDFEEALPGEDLNGLKSTPGAYLGSCRYKLPESLEDPVYPALFKKFEDSKMIILAETILKAFSETSMRLKLIDNDIIHMELVNSSVEIFLSDDEFCNIVANLGAINPKDRDELISGELQPFLNLDSGENGYLYVDDKGNLRYTLMFDYKKTSSKRLAKLIEKRVSFAMQLKQKYQDYSELVYGNEE